MGLIPSSKRVQAYTRVARESAVTRANRSPSFIGTRMKLNLSKLPGKLTSKKAINYRILLNQTRSQKRIYVQVRVCADRAFTTLKKQGKPITKDAVYSLAFELREKEF